MDPQMIVNFTCQRCHQPVHLDQGFSHLSEITMAELLLPIHAGSEVDFGNRKLDKTVNPFRFYDLSTQTHDFTIVGDSPENQKLPSLKVATKLFDMLSSNSDIDHPLCEECTDTVVEGMDSNVNRLDKQISLYNQLFTSKPDFVMEDIGELEKQLEILKEEETRLSNELADVEGEQKAAKESLGKFEKEKEQLEEEEANYWREYCAYRSHVISMEDENQSIRSRMGYMSNQMERLRQMNVFNATFHIWYSGHFGTINNMRLGRLPTVPVAWPEINAAWGQTVLLITSLAKKIGLKFTKYNLVPHGNTSYVQVIAEKNKELPLYRHGGIRFMWDHGFDMGMAAFLECLAEFQQHIESSGFQESRDARKFCLPYRVNKHFMEDHITKANFSIKMQFNGEEQWTKALKFILTNLKWALTWVSSPKVTMMSSETSSSSPSH